MTAWRVVVPLVDGVDDLALGGVLAALGTAKRLGVADITTETVAAEALVTTAAGARMVPTRLGWEALRPAAGLIMVGGPGVAERAAADVELAGALRAHLNDRDVSRVLASVGSGALVLARVGALDGREATTGRADRDALAPLVASVPLGARVVADGRVLTAVGPAAGVELGLDVVRRFADETAANTVGDDLEVRGWVPARGAT